MSLAHLVEGANGAKRARSARLRRQIKAALAVAGVLGFLRLVECHRSDPARRAWGNVLPPGTKKRASNRRTIMRRNRARGSLMRVDPAAQTTLNKDGAKG